MTTSGMVLEVQRMSTEDGPGIRTTIFFKGCSLACSWCHNPESISAKPELVWHGTRCIGCRSCLATCPNGNLSLGADRLTIDRTRCRECFACADECPGLALEVQGHRVELDALVEELSRDRAFYEASGGGVTLSGGEPTMQSVFAGALLDRCQKAGIHTALDTCGHCPTDQLMNLASHVDLVLYDLKEIDSELHRLYTGKGNDRILSNLRTLSQSIRESYTPPSLWIRTPLVPGVTASKANITSIGQLIAEELADVVSRWELCAFNNLCSEKYSRLGRSWEHSSIPRLSDYELESLAEAARASGVKPEIIHATGMTRLATFEEQPASSQEARPL
jgi:pyruvate formate lyase activating enzyme